MNKLQVIDYKQLINTLIFVNKSLINNDKYNRLQIELKTKGLEKMIETTQLLKMTTDTTRYYIYSDQDPGTLHIEVTDPHDQDDMINCTCLDTGEAIRICGWMGIWEVDDGSQSSM